MKSKAEAIQEASANSMAVRRHGIDAVRRFVAEIRSQLAENKPEWEIAEEVGLSWAEYNEIKREMYRWDTAKLYDRPVEQQYIDYVIRQEACITDLDSLISELTPKWLNPAEEGDTKAEQIQHNITSSSAQTRLGAIRAKSNIFDIIIKTGQTMGILEKAPERRQIVAGIVVSQLDSDELRGYITHELVSLEKLVKRYGQEKPLPAPDGHDDLPVLDVELIEPHSQKPDFSKDEKPFFARNAPSRAAGGKATARKRHSGEVIRTKVARSGQDVV